MFVTLWEFEVKPGSEELFERTYGSHGRWAEWFRRDARYLGTRLLRDMSAARVYVTVDSWESRAAYEEFRKKYGAEYEELDRESAGMTVREKHTMDGGPLGDESGPFRLVAPHEKRPARWARMLKSITVVRATAQ